MKRHRRPKLGFFWVSGFTSVFFHWVCWAGGQAYVGLIIEVHLDGEPHASCVPKHIGAPKDGSCKFAYPHCKVWATWSDTGHDAIGTWAVFCVPVAQDNLRYTLDGKPCTRDEAIKVGHAIRINDCRAGGFYIDSLSLNQTLQMPPLEKRFDSDADPRDAVWSLRFEGPFPASVQHACLKDQLEGTGKSVAAKMTMPEWDDLFKISAEKGPGIFKCQNVDFKVGGIAPFQTYGLDNAPLSLEFASANGRFVSGCINNYRKVRNVDMNLGVNGTDLRLEGNHVRGTLTVTLGSSFNWRLLSDDHQVIPSLTRNLEVDMTVTQGVVSGTFVFQNDRENPKRIIGVLRKPMNLDDMPRRCLAIFNRMPGFPDCYGISFPFPGSHEPPESGKVSCLLTKKPLGEFQLLKPVSIHLEGNRVKAVFQFTGAMGDQNQVSDKGENSDADAGPDNMVATNNNWLESGDVSVDGEITGDQWSGILNMRWKGQEQTTGFSGHIHPMTQPHWDIWNFTHDKREVAGSKMCPGYVRGPGNRGGVPVEWYPSLVVGGWPVDLEVFKTRKNQK